MKKVFISGSISVKDLSLKIKNRLDNMIKNNLSILVGDAEGIDSAVQMYFSKNNYFNVTVYSITENPRQIKSSKFNKKFIKLKEDLTTKRERERQREKDKAMTEDSDYSLVIWDGKSKGSFNNILRSLEQNKPVIVYFTKNDDFLPKNKVNKVEISYIYYDLNGYSGDEILEVLRADRYEFFKSARELNKFLKDKNVIEKKENIYMPCEGYENLFKIEYYRGKPTNLRFSMDFYDWLMKQTMDENSSNQQEGFGF